MDNNNFKIENYTLGRTLGIGAFAKVKIAKHDITGLNVAVKIINRKKMQNAQMNKKIKREIALLKIFNHSNITRLYEVLETTADIYVIMEYISGGDLFDIIAQKGKLSEQDSKVYFRQIVSGVEYCHSRLVAHRDLKPENILIDENNTVKIADFGLSNLMRDGKYLTTSCGSPNYAAPEVISGRIYCGTEIDVWSCGVILFALLAGYLPFDEEFTHELYKKIKESDYIMPSSFSPEAKDIVHRMLQPEPQNRIKFTELRLHPWLRENVPFYVEVFNLNSHKTEATHRINEEAFQKLVSIDYIRSQMKQYNINELGLRNLLLKDGNSIFKVSYNLIADDIKKTEILKNKSQG